MYSVMFDRVIIYRSIYTALGASSTVGAQSDFFFVKFVLEGGWPCYAYSRQLILNMSKEGQDWAAICDVGEQPMDCIFHPNENRLAVCDLTGSTSS